MIDQNHSWSVKLVLLFQVQLVAVSKVRPDSGHRAGGGAKISGSPLAAGWLVGWLVGFISQAHTRRLHFFCVRMKSYWIWLNMYEYMLAYVYIMHVFILYIYTFIFLFIWINTYLHMYIYIHTPIQCMPRHVTSLVKSWRGLTMWVSMQRYQPQVLILWPAMGSTKENCKIVPSLQRWSGIQRYCQSHPIGRARGRNHDPWTPRSHEPSASY